jgi:glutathione peroxidase
MPIGWSARDGHIAAAFASTVEPTDTRVITAIAKELNAGS